MKTGSKKSKFIKCGYSPTQCTSLGTGGGLAAKRHCFRPFKRRIVCGKASAKNSPSDSSSPRSAAAQSGRRRSRNGGGGGGVWELSECRHSRRPLGGRRGRKTEAETHAYRQRYAQRRRSGRIRQSNRSEPVLETSTSNGNESSIDMAW